MEFEFDDRKSLVNKKKHDIDFVEAQQIWRDENYFQIRLSAEDEPRFAVIGLIGGRHWTAIVTHRQSAIRIISVRRARKEEIAAYD